MKPNFIFFLSLLLIFITACDSNRFDVDVSNITVKEDLKRFDLDLWEAAKGGIDQGELQVLANNYPDMLQLYVSAIMRFGAIESPEALEILNKFLADEAIAELYQDVVKKYPESSLEAHQLELNDAFKRWKFHFPDKITPSIRTMVSAFTYSTAVNDSLLIVSLDNFMGEDFKLYPQAGIPKYKFTHFSEEFLVPDALKAWAMTEFEASAGQNILEQMIYHGKITYLLQALLPEYEAHLLLDYKTDEYQWCVDNEEQIWFHFVDMDLLYSNETHQIRKYMGDAPFVAGFPEGSPGRVGQYIGFQIVKAYMDKNSEMSLQDMMKNKDANSILRKSKFKPKR